MLLYPSSWRAIWDRWLISDGSTMLTWPPLPFSAPIVLISSLVSTGSRSPSLWLSVFSCSSTISSHFTQPGAVQIPIQQRIHTSFQSIYYFRLQGCRLHFGGITGTRRKFSSVILIATSLEWYLPLWAFLDISAKRCFYCSYHRYLIFYIPPPSCFE